MRVITSTVVDGKIDLAGERLEEGLQVAILAPDAGEPIELSPEEQQELVLAMEEIRRGDFVDGDDLLDEIRSRA